MAAIDALTPWRDRILIEQAARRLSASGAPMGASQALAVPLADYIESTQRARAAAGEIEASTLDSYLSVLAHHVTPHIPEGLPLGSVTPAHVRDMLAGIASSGAGDTKRRQAFSLVSGTLAIAVRDEGLPENPCTHVRRPARAAPRHNPLSPTAAQGLLALLLSMEPSREVTAGILTLLTGEGPGELCGLEWGSACWGDSETISVTQAVGSSTTKGGGYLKRPKNASRIRVVPATPLVQRVLRRRYEAARAEWGELSPGPRDFVLGFPGGRWASPTTISRAWTALSRAHSVCGAQGRPCTLYDLRHTFATLLGHVPVATPRDVQELMGHASLSMTMEAYTHSAAAAKRDALDALEEMLLGPGGATKP